MGDHGISPTAIATGVLAPALGASALLVGIGVLLIVCVSLFECSAGGVLLRLLGVVRGRERHRRVLGVHCRLVGAAAT